MPRPKPGEQKQKPRPLVPINWDTVDHRLFCQISGEKIAAEIGIHPQTLYDRCKIEKGVGWTEYMTAKKSNGQAAILAGQFEKAVKYKSEKMLIHLGQIYCDQLIKSGVEHSGSININRVDYTTAQLADYNAANAPSETLSDTSLELPGQGG